MNGTNWKELTFTTRIGAAGTGDRLPDLNPAQVTLTSPNIGVGGMIGLAFLLTMVIVIWRFRSSAYTVANYLTFASTDGE